ncbi:MAG: hypothetical protein HQL56_10755 [Magnetococcales bacterium]|nr:hypothetical protein [Magnetococcales bacterium]
MLKTVEAEIGVDGQVRLWEPLPLTCRQRAGVTVPESVPDDAEEQHNRAVLHVTEKSLAQDWDRPEEEEAWAYLQPDR